MLQGGAVKAVLPSILIGLIVLVVVLRLMIGSCKAFFIVASISGTVQAVILLWYGISYILGRRKKYLQNRATVDQGHRIRLEYSFLYKVAGLPKKFTYGELDSATGSFRELLGRGASASVFKGVLPDGTDLAVKRINGSDQGHREFEAEVAAIGAVNHINLVRLLGFCAEGANRILVYEYVSNGNLASWIFGQRRRGAHVVQVQVLGWARRFEIAVGVAKALAYLHHDCRKRILHLDVKPENILLDSGFEAKVTDFGLSKLMGRDESRVMTTMRGTRGYLAPEWLLDRGIDVKSDVYSFGMVVMELIGGRRNVSQGWDGFEGNGKKWSYLPRVVMKKAREGRLMEVVDGRLERDSVDDGQLRLLVKVAVWCIQEKSTLRPSMNKVVDMLEGRCEVDDPPETKMIIVDLLNLDQDTSTTTNETESGTSSTRGIMGEEREQDERTDPINFGGSLSCSYTMSVVSGR